MTFSPDFPATAPCPCCSLQPYADCCAPYHRDQALPPTAEALMRSRYAAYVLGLDAYLLQTWHPTTRPKELFAAGDARPAWTGLSIEACEGGGPGEHAGEVTFSARYRDQTGEASYRECSLFTRMEGRWHYVRAKAESSPSRSGPCPCGSRRKFKRCCGR